MYINNIYLFYNKLNNYQTTTCACFCYTVCNLADLYVYNEQYCTDVNHLHVLQSDKCSVGKVYTYTITLKIHTQFDNFCIGNYVYL